MKMSPLAAAVLIGGSLPASAASAGPDAATGGVLIAILLFTIAFALFVIARPVGGMITGGLVFMLAGGGLAADAPLIAGGPFILFSGGAILLSLGGALRVLTQRMDAAPRKMAEESVRAAQREAERARKIDGG